jgi:iron complex outermembrane receptor protein
MVRRFRSRRSTAGLLAGCAFLCWSPAALGQTSTPPEGVADASPDIIVTARLRKERDIDVPVAISSVTGQEIERHSLTDLSAITQQIPTLKLDSASTLAFGGQITLRGITSTPSTASIDQAVSINVDGVPISYAGIVRLGQFDLQQVDVLKGPQALFFGKNASAGIIVLKSAEPTPQLDIMLRGGYETEAAERFIEGHVSGPLADGITGRIAMRYSKLDGWVDNILPTGAPGVFGPPHREAPDSKEFMAKAALNFDFSGAFSMKLRGAIASSEGAGAALAQRYYCPLGVPQGQPTYPGEECKLDHQSSQGDLNPALHAIDARFPADGVPYSKVKQQLVSNEANWDVLEHLRLTSITGFYNVKFDAADQLSFGPVAVVNSVMSVHRNAFSQELRVTSSFDGPFNWIGGLFYEHSYDAENQQLVIGAPVPRVGDVVIKGQTVSPFVSASYKLTDSLELSGGVRYSDEIKKQSNAMYPGLLRPRISFTNWSPAGTISYKISHDINLFASYRTGFKSGGFQTDGNTLPRAISAGRHFDNSFGPETADGFEFGLKGLFADRRLRFNATVFDYTYKGLQLARFDATQLALILSNVGRATTKGVELDFHYEAPIEGLSFEGALAYNKAEYKDYMAGCYVGATPATGCDPVTNLRNLAGRPLARAPIWAGNIGAAYEGGLTSALRYRLDASMTYSGSFYTVVDLIPGGYQKSYETYDFGVALYPSNKRWEIAFIGRNLTDRLWATASGAVPLTGSAAVQSDIYSNSTPRGRELLFRLTYRPTN